MASCAPIATALIKLALYIYNHGRGNVASINNECLGFGSFVNQDRIWTCRCLSVNFSHQLHITINIMMCGPVLMSCKIAARQGCLHVDLLRTVKVTHTLWFIAFLCIIYTPNMYWYIVLVVEWLQKNDFRSTVALYASTCGSLDDFHEN